MEPDPPGAVGVVFKIIFHRYAGLSPRAKGGGGGPIWGKVGLVGLVAVPGTSILVKMCQLIKYLPCNN